MSEENSCCQGMGCKVESVLSVDERGQILLPKDVRERAGIRPGDKLALISWESDGKVCCLALIRAGELTAMVKTMLAPVMKNLSE